MTPLLQADPGDREDKGSVRPEPAQDLRGFIPIALPDSVEAEADPPAIAARKKLHGEARDTARELHASLHLSERIDIYNQRGRRLVNLAAALYPELMPCLNGDFEHLELTKADHD